MALASAVIASRVEIRRGGGPPATIRVRPAGPVSTMVAPLKISGESARRVRATRRRCARSAGSPSIERWSSRCSSGVIRKSAIALILLVIFGAAAGFFSAKVPSSFLPDEDQGYLYINLQLPNAASLQRTDEVAHKIEAALAKTPGVQYTTSVVGFSLLSFVRTSYNGFFFVTLKPWDDRKSRDEQFQQIKQNINRELSRRLRRADKRIAELLRGE